MDGGTFVTGKLIGKRIGTIVLSAILCCACALMFAACSTETYQPKEKTPSISTPTIGKEGTLRVGVDANSSPFAGTTSSSGIVGINVDVGAALADELGLKLEIVDYGSDPAKALSAGNVDIAMGVDSANSTYSFWTSNVYIESAVALFSVDASDKMPKDSSSNAKIAAQTSSMSAWEVNKQFGENALVSSESLKAAFSDLVSGTVDYVAADAVIGTFASYQDDAEVSIIGLLQKPTGYSIGVNEDNAKLKQSISAALNAISENGIIDLIEKKWLGNELDLSSLELSSNAKSSASADASQKSSEEGSGDATASDAANSAATAAGTNSSDTELDQADQSASANASSSSAPDATLLDE